MQPDEVSEVAKLAQAPDARSSVGATKADSSVRRDDAGQDKAGLG